MSYNPNNPNGQATMANSAPVTIASDQSALSVATHAVTQSGTWNITNVSGTVSLPTGASTAAKQPALGTAGSASADVITIQGIASMTAVKVDGSAVTQPISGTITANAGTNLNTSALALDTTLTGGTQQTKITDGTNIANVVANNSVTTGNAGNAQLIAGTGFTTTTISLSAGTQATSWYDLLNYSWVSVGVLTNASGATLSFQTASDSSQTNIRGMSMTDSGAGAGGNSNVAQMNTTSGVATYAGQRQGRYFRVNSNLSGGNTATIVITFYTAAAGATVTGVNSITNIGGSVPSAAYYVGMQDASGNLIGLINATRANNTTGTGLLGVGLLEWDGTNYQRVPSARFAPSTTTLNTYSVHLTSNTTTTPTSSTAYISAIAISNEIAGTTSTISIQDKQGTPLKLVNGLTTTALTTTPTTITFNTPVKMVSGIDIITAGVAAATVDVWINYYQ